ncbi:MAG: ABC transporter substrate-binding protein [Eubacteriales bacterium]
MKKSKLLSILLASSLVLSVTACGSSSTPEVSNTETTTTTETTESAETSETSDKNEVIIANNAELYDWDPIKGWGKNENPLMQSKLVVADDLGTIKLDLASNYSANEDATVWTFELREDVKFNDGEDFTADDVVFTIETAKEAASAVDFTIVNSVVALDDYTVEFTLNYQASTFIYQMATLAMLPAHAYSEDTYADNPIGTGPYQMVQWDKGQQIILEQNPYYYGEVSNIERIVMVFMDATTGLAAVQSGQVDIAMADITTSDVSVDGYTLNQFVTTDNAGISMPYIPAQVNSPIDVPVGNDVTSDLAIRQALSYAIDREYFSQYVLNGYGEPSYSITHSLLWENQDARFEDGQVDKAIEILEEAGWVDSDNDGIREKEGLVATFEVLYPSGNTTREMIANGFAQVGVDLGIDIVPTGKSWDEIFQLYNSTPFVMWVGSVTPYTYFQNTTIASAGNISANMGFYHNETVEEYMSAAMAAPTVEEANELWKLSQWDGTTGSSMIGDAPVVWLANVSHMYFIRDGLDIGEQGLHGHGGSGMQILSNIEEWVWK